MKPTFTVLFCTMLSINAFAQIDLKGFLAGTFIQYEKINTKDTFYVNTNQKELRFRPIVAMSIGQGDKNFHEIAISNIEFKKMTIKTGSTNINGQDAENLHFSLRFGYSYNYCWLKYSRRWTPYVGLQSNVTFIESIAREKFPQNKIKSLGLHGRIGGVAGVQFALREHIRLEFVLPIDIYFINLQRQKITGSSPANNQILQYASHYLIQNEELYIPFRLGLTLRL